MKLLDTLIRPTLAACLVASLAFTAAAPAQAAAPQVKVQVPGYYRMMLGQAEVTALFDGAIELDAKLLHNATPAEIQKLLARMFVTAPKMPTGVNAYLVNVGGKLVLVDSGAGKLFGPTLGNVVSNLKAAGYTPEQVDVVLVTHLHADHFGGLVDAEGKPAFANATIRVAQKEADFWLSEAEAAKVPEEKRGFFKMARDAAAVLKAAGKWQPFASGDELAPGFTAVPTVGHTPGHTSYELSSDGQKLLLLGDLVHNAHVQFPRPDVTIEFDTDSKQAAITRKAVFKAAAESKELVGGAHLPFPGLGHVRSDSKTAYSWVPVEFAPLK